MRAVLACSIAFALLLTGCGKSGGIQSKAAIQAAIENHLRQRPNVILSNMTLEVQDVRFDGDKAATEVNFRSKQAPDLVVRVRYMLRRAGDHWEVESSSPIGGMSGSPHGSGGGAAPTPVPSTPTPQPSH
jgi:hypothetical protein